MAFTKELWPTFPKGSSVPTLQLTADDIAVFVVGPSGSGKSLFVKEVTKSGQIKVGKGLKPYTTTVTAIRCELTEDAKKTLGNVKQKHIVLIDTPSFHTGFNDEFAEKEMENWLVQSNCQSNLVVVIYMHRVESKPPYEPIQRHLDTFARKFPLNFHCLPRRILVVFSYDGVIPKEVVQKRKKEFEEQQLHCLRPALGGRLIWNVSSHPQPLEWGDTETAWDAVVALCSKPHLQAESRDGQWSWQVAGKSQHSLQVVETPPIRGTFLPQTKAEQQHQTDTEHLTASQQPPEVVEALSTTVALAPQTSSEQQSQPEEHPATAQWSLRAAEEPHPAPAPIGIEDLRPEDSVIAIIGPKSSGKSTFICVASNPSTQSIGQVSGSSTSHVQAIRFWGQECDRHAVLLDTPGFDDASTSCPEILGMISDWLDSSYGKGKLLSGMLYLHRITNDRLAGTPLKALRLIRKLCGKDALDKVWLTTTMWDDVDPSVGERRLSELVREPWEAMISQGAHVARCRSDDDSPKQLVEQILDYEVTREVVLLQDEMVSLKMEFEETEAGRELCSQLEDLIKGQTALLQRINEERKAASDASELEELQTEYNDLQSQIDDKFRQMQELTFSQFTNLLRPLPSSSANNV